MFTLKKSKEIPKIKIVLTNIESLMETLSKEQVGEDYLILGLPVSEFIINVIEIPSAILSEEEKDDFIMEKLIENSSEDYDPMECINREFIVKIEAGLDKAIILSLTKEKVDAIIARIKLKRVSLKGIYPSFLLDDKLDIEEITKKADIIFLGNEEYFKVKNQLLIEEGDNYNFLGEDLKEELGEPLFNNSIIKIIYLIIIIQVIMFISFSFLRNRTTSKIEAIKKQAIILDKKAKDLETKIKLIPDWEKRMQEEQKLIERPAVEVTGIIYALKETIPKGVYIDKLEIGLQLIRISGTTGTLDKVIDFERALYDKGFLNIKHTTINNSKNAVSFILEINL